MCVVILHFYLKECGEFTCTIERGGILEIHLKEFGHYTYASEILSVAIYDIHLKAFGNFTHAFK